MASGDLGLLVTAHVERFNAAVRSGSYEEFVAGFAADAVMSFGGAPPVVGRSIVGRSAIRQAYESQPPTDTLTVVSVSGTPADAEVAFAWDHGGTGTMHLSWSGGLVTRLAIAFD
jgi:hypothetical protein